VILQLTQFQIRAAVALVEFKASIMLIVSLWAYDSRVLSVTPSKTWKLLSAVEYHIPGAVKIIMP
jgi:hypothetical protein